MASASIEGGDPTGPGVSTPDGQTSQQGTGELYRAALYFQSKLKILELVRIFSEHGYLSLEEVAIAMHRASEIGASNDVATLRTRIRSLETAIQAERFSRDLTAWERDEAELALTSERELMQESVARIASLEAQLKDARRTTLKLIAASRNGLSTLKRVRDHLAPETYAAGALAPLVQDFRELTQVVQELHALAMVRASTAPMVPPAP